MDAQSVIDKILRELHEVKVPAFVKGSFGYGVPHAESDIDIQIDLNEKAIIDGLTDYFGGQLDKVYFQDSTGNSYDSYLISFVRHGCRIDLIYDDDPAAFARVRQIIGEINQLSLADKFILRLVSGPYKYDRSDAYRILLAIFGRYRQTMPKELVNQIECGESIEERIAQTIRMVVQILYTNEVGSTYRRRFLHDIQI